MGALFLSMKQVPRDVFKKENYTIKVKKSNSWSLCLNFVI